jgi:DNA-binding MarR family transcriptional regulator
MAETANDRKQTKAELIDQIGMAFRRDQNRSDVFDELVAERLGINSTDLRCLDIIQQHDRITAGRLAELAGLTTGAVTSVLDRIERLGYARRVRDTDDRRRVLVEMTEDALEAMWKLYGPAKEEWEQMFSRYTADELRVFLAMLTEAEEVGRRQLERLRSLEAERVA